MTVSSTVRTAGPFIGTGLVSAYAFSYKVFEDSDVVAQTTDTSGTLTTLTLDSDYTVALNADQNASPGGTVNLAVALGAGVKLELSSNLPLLQETHITNAGGFFPQIIEDALDRSVIMIQQALTFIGGAIRVPEAAGVPLLPAAAARANTIFAFDSSGNPIVSVPISGSAADVLIQIADTTAANKGAGASGFNYLLNYATRTVGWALRVGTVKAAWFSSSVVAGDWVPALIAAATWAATGANGGIVELDARQAYTCKSNLPWNTNLVGLRMNGAVLDFSSVSAAGFIGIAPTQSNGDANFRSALNTVHEIEGGIILGPGSGVTATAMKGLDTNLIAGGAWLSDITVRNVAFVNWWRDVELNAGTFRWHFVRCVMIITGFGSAYDTSIYIPNASNSGEDSTFTQCVLGKVYGSVLKQDNPNAVTAFRLCNGDYNANLMVVTAGTVDWDGYLESNTDTDNWVRMSGENTFVRIAGSIAVTGSKSAFEMFSVDPSCTNGGLDLDVSLMFAGGVSYGNLNLCKGLTAATSGRVNARLRAHSHTTVHPAIGGGCTVFSNAEFIGASLTDWALTGTTPPSIAALPSAFAGASAGARCLRFAGSLTNNPSATRTVPCRQGQQAVGSLWYQTQAQAASGATFAVTIKYLDFGNAVLASVDAVLVTTTVSVWTFLNISQMDPAPPGTASALLVINETGATGSNVPNAYIYGQTLAVV